jgi:hypothetical protein
MLDKLLKFFGGFDIFIAHSFRDASSYAQALALKLNEIDIIHCVRKPSLQRRDIIDLEKSLRTDLRKSSFLVLLLSKAALEHPKWLNWEFVEFTRKHSRNFVVIDVDGYYSTTDLTGTPFGRLKDRPYIREDSGQVVPAEPSPQVVKSIMHHFPSKRESIQRSLWIVFALGVIAGVIVTCTVLWFIRI